MKTLQPTIILIAIIVTVGIIATTFFTLENNLAKQNQEEKIQARVHVHTENATGYINGTKYVKISDLDPGSAVRFAYPYTGNDTIDEGINSSWELVRLPEDFGGDKNDISSFRAYSMFDIHTGCLVIYRPQSENLVDGCHDDTFEPVNGIAVAGLAKDYNFKNNALPNLDLGVDDEGYIYVKQPTFEIDKNGIIGLGRKVPDIMLKSDLVIAHKIRSIVDVIIPPDSEDSTSGLNFTPQNVTVVIGVNNTVHWINKAMVANTIEADNHHDMLFYKTTHEPSQTPLGYKTPNFLAPNKSFNFTFTKPGIFGYHTEPHPWLRGWVTVLPPNAKEIVPQTSESTTVPTSFMPCDTPYPQSNTDVAVLYMPTNSIGKICVRYSNFNDFAEPIHGIRIFDPNNSYQNATGITIWSDFTNDTIPKGNFTAVYWIKTGNQTGFYGLDLFCGGTPFAVGYDSNSRIVSSDFPFIGIAVSCPASGPYSQIDSLTGIGVKYIQYP